MSGRRALKFWFASILVQIAEATSNSLATSHCQAFCRVIVPACTTETVCNADGFCEHLFWSSESRRYAVQLVFSVNLLELSPVTCVEASIRMLPPSGAVISDYEPAGTVVPSDADSASPDSPESGSPALKRTRSNPDDEDDATTTAVPTPYRPLSSVFRPYRQTPRRRPYIMARLGVPTDDPVDDEETEAETPIPTAVETEEPDVAYEQEWVHGLSTSESVPTLYPTGYFEDLDLSPIDTSHDVGGIDSTGGTDELNVDDLVARGLITPPLINAYEPLEAEGVPPPAGEPTDVQESIFNIEQVQQLVTFLTPNDADDEEDLIRSPRSPWDSLPGSERIQDALAGIVDIVEDGVIQRLLKFPFWLGDSSTPVAVLSEALVELAPLVQPEQFTPVQITTLRGLMHGIESIRRWRHAIGAMVAVCINEPAVLTREDELGFVLMQVAAYAKYLALVGGNTHDFLPDHLIQTLLTSDMFTNQVSAAQTPPTNAEFVTAVTESSIGQDHVVIDVNDFEAHEDSTDTDDNVVADFTVDVNPSYADVPLSSAVVLPPTTIPTRPVDDSTALDDLRAAMTPRHASLACPGCRRMRLPHQDPRSVEDLTKLLFAQLDRNRNPKQRLLLREHLMELIKLVGDQWLSNQVQFCLKYGDGLVMHAVSAGSLNADERHDVLNFARRCQSGLSMNVRREFVPQLLLMTYPRPTYWTEGGAIEVTQLVNASSSIAETVDALSTLTKLDFLGDLTVTFTGSVAVGSGPRTELIAKALAAAFNPANGLFAYSDERETLMKPTALVGDPTSELRSRRFRTYRQVGRLLGLSIGHGIAAGVFFTSGCLALLREPEHQVDPDNAEVLSRWLAEEDPELATNLNKLADDPEVLGAMLGMPFPDDVTELTTDNVMEYIMAWRRYHVVESVDTQMRLITDGIYDVLPYPQLAWLGVEELRLVLEGTREVDRDALRRSATYLLPYGSNSSSIPEITWFWEIVADMSDVEIRDLLQFVSGSRNPPVHGFTGPRGDREWLQIVLDSSIPTDRVPRSQLCFTQLKIPRYSSKEVMAQRLAFAFGNCNSVDQL